MLRDMHVIRETRMQNKSLPYSKSADKVNARRERGCLSVCLSIIVVSLLSGRGKGHAAY